MRSSVLLNRYALALACALLFANFKSHAQVNGPKLKLETFLLKQAAQRDANASFIPAKSLKQ